MKKEMLVGSILNLLKKIVKRVIWWCSVKKVFLKNRKIHWKTPVPESFFLKMLQAKALHFKKFLKLFKNTYFYRTPPVAE